MGLSQRRRIAQAAVGLLLLTAVLAGPGVSRAQAPEAASAATAPSSTAESVAAPATAAAEVAPRSYRPLLDDVRPSSFKGITPGVTRLDGVEDVLGKATGRRDAGEETVLTFRVGPFPNVEITGQSGVVVSIVVNLPSKVAREQIERELGLQVFCPVTLTSAVGEPVGIAYPERGVMLTVSSPQQPETVLQLVLETITAESFVRRAEHDTQQQWQSQLADLEYAVRIDSTNAEAHWRKAELLLAIGRAAEALESMDRAVALQPAGSVYRLTRAVVLADLGRGRDAAEEIQRIFKAKEVSAYVQAFAYNLLGTLLASPPQRQYAQALKHRLTAVQLATPLASEERIVLRRQSRQLLVRTYLDIAQDIAAGDWRDKPAAMAKWLRGAREIADAMVQQDGADDSLRLLVLREAVAAYADLHEFVPTCPLDEALELAERLLLAADDPLYKPALQRDLVKLQFDASQVYRVRGDSARARQLAQQAVALCAEVWEPVELSPRQEEWIGRLYFYMGSLCAVQEENHREAVRWYERAQPLLSPGAPTEASTALGAHGERLVSMGVSYWGAGARNEALRLTKAGLEAMQQASQAGRLPRRALVVPYSNLASMYKLVGKKDEARKMAVLAAKLEAEQQPAVE